jgi:hypothetical protein
MTFEIQRQISFPFSSFIYLWPVKESRMKMQLPRMSILLPILALLFRDTAANSATQTISNLAAWQSLDACAQSCFQHGEGIGCTWAPLDAQLGCSKTFCSELAVNDCYCRTDKQSAATSYLSSCISRACTIGDPGVDVNSGVGIYKGYCTSLGYQAEPASALVPATGTATLPAGTVSCRLEMALCRRLIYIGSTAASGNGPSPGTTNESSPPSGSGGGLSPAVISGIALASLILTVLATWVAWLQYKIAKKDRMERLGSVSYR